MADIQEHRAVPRIDCYSRSMFDDNVEHGLVIDISETGAGLTVSKDTPLLKDVDPQQAANSHGCLRLNIFHPDCSEENILYINANIAWIDREYSKDRLKLGVHFSEMDDSKSGYVSNFIDWIQKEENYFLRCDLEKC
jgi:c-di-GMP-binding flagellar brake protein YcgR